MTDEQAERLIAAVERICDLLAEKSLARPRIAGDFVSPFGSLKQFQYRVDRITEWVEKHVEKNRHKSVPGDDPNFDAAFQKQWGMTWDYWTVLRERCEAFYTEQMRMGT